MQIRNYPRSCKFYPPIVWGSVVTFLATGYCENREGATTETSQKTCHAYFIIAFEEKALSLMSRNYSIRHFIHHSDSEKVSYDNKLCQVYLVCPAEVSSSGHFNNKKQR